MSQYLARVRDVDPNDSEAVKDALTVFFQNLLKFKSASCNQWLNALENVINRFPKYCGQHRATIENYLIPFLDSTSYNLVIIAGKCAHSLQQVRPPQEKAASAKSCWRALMAALCEAAHSLIEALFPRSAAHHTKGHIDTDNSVLLQALCDIDNVRELDASTKTALLRVRLRNVLVFIQAMLVEIYPVGKPIRPQLILEVILRALSATGIDDEETIASVKVEALRTMDALVACVGSNLLPFSPLLIRLAVQTLRWTAEQNSAHARKVRTTAYNSLSSWLLHLRCERPAGDRAAWDAQLTSHILADITPAKPLIQVNETSHQSMKNLSKKARKKMANTMLKQSNIASHMPGEKNKINISEEPKDEIAIAALECAEAFLTVCGRFLKPLVHKQLVEALVRLCGSASTRGDRGVAALKALEAARRTTSNPPTQYCLDIYSRLINCPDVEVSRLCSQALLDIRLHLHCAPPSLHYTAPTEKKPDRKRVSDRNRQVLEHLLGKERMPSAIAEEEDVISIPDEPSSKRPRTSDEQISLSSESQASSIEVSDDSERDGESIILLYPEDEENDGDDALINEAVEINDEIDAANVTESNVAEESVIEENNDTEKSVGENSSTNSNVTEDNNAAEELNTEGPLTQSDKTNETETQINEKKLEIFDAVTQLPLHVSNDTADGEKSPVSMEVTYDYPNSIDKPEKVVLEKIDDVNLPSSNETDDIQITCGQEVKSSQDFGDHSGKNKEFVSEEPPKENGIEKSHEEVVINGEIEILTEKLVKNGEVTVEDMLADFVDEVNEDTQASA